MATGNEEEEIPSNERPRPLHKRKNLALRLLCALILLAIILLFIAIICVLVLAPSHSSDQDGSRSALDWVELAVPPELESVYPFNETRQLMVPPGYDIAVYAHVPSARFLLALPGGDVLVSQPEEGKISLLRSPQRRVREAQPVDFATGLDVPNDMVLHADGRGDRYLYVSQATRVTRHLYVKGDTAIRTPYVIIDDLPYSRQDLHPHKTIAIVNDTLYVSIGSTLDANPTDLQTDPKRGAIYGYQLTGERRRLITAGLRNVGNMAIAPNTNNLWAVVSQRDNLTYPLKDKNYGNYDIAYRFDNPVDEFVQIVEGENYGWPHCNPTLKDKEYGAPEYVPDYDFNRDEKAVLCSTKRKVDAAIRPHSKPMGLTFWSGEKIKKDFKSNVIAVVALNDNAYWGNRVIYYNWRNGKPELTPNDLVSGWMRTRNIDSRWGQPVDIAVLDEESILISDNFAGAIYKLYKTFH
uniref:Pyrroloquinoline quinone-dependent pyranose dehydrogenase beta-propeller domain-containing protein n=1 Tax=Strigamia maritima TaxID=126957 RepID=T1J8X3_STRMM